MPSSLEEDEEIERICIDLENSNKLSDSPHPINVQACIERNVRSFREEQFDEFLIQAVDEAITSLGAPVKNALYQHLEDDFNISKNDIPKKIVKFSEIIHKIFGLGASRLEIKFVKNLCSRIQTDIKNPELECLSRWIVRELSFDEYVDHLREDYLTQTPETH